jgi:hypothetical protein
VSDRKGHNTKSRDKKAYPPVVAFIDDSREYAVGKLRKGVNMSREEAAAFIRNIKSQLPGCIKRVLIRADGEFLNWQTVAAGNKEGFEFIIANEGCRHLSTQNMVSS